jgi:hypothetical protein
MSPKAWEYVPISYTVCDANLDVKIISPQPLTDKQRRIKELEKKLRDTEMERDILKKPWPSSAKHRSDFSDNSKQSLVIFGEEDVPCPRGFSERLLFMEKTCPIQAVKPYGSTSLKCPISSEILI